MTALNFPSSPTIGQTYTANGGTWEWDGTTWVSKNILDVTLGGTGASTFTSQRLLVGQGTTAVTSSLIADNGTRVTVNAPTTLTAPNSSAAAWLTSGINLVVSPATFTDTTSSGTIGDVSINRFGAQTMAATSATTVTRLFGAYFANPAAGTNVTASNPYALGTDSLRVEGTVFVAASGAGTVQLGAGTTTGPTILGGTSQTGTMTLGQSTVSQTTNIQAGATASGSTKTINIGTGGLTGSTTAITLGSTNGTSTVGVNAATTAVTGVLSTSLGTVSAPSYTFTGDTNTGMWSPAADTLAFSEGGTEVMRINSSGNVGIGTVSPSGRLHVATTQTTSVIQRWAADLAVSGNRGINLVSPTTDSASEPFYYDTGNAYAWHTDGAEAMRINSSGNVGIGTTAPATKLHVAGRTTLATPNTSAAAWTTSGINLVQSATTFTDTTSTGTVADIRINNFAAQTLDSTNAVTATQFYGTYFTAPVAGTNVTASERWALGVDSLRVVGTSSITGTLNVGAGLNVNSVTSAINIGTSQTSGLLTLGNTAGTGTITLGQSTVSQTTNIQAGATASGSTKTINIGGGGLAGSTTTISIGSTASATSMTVNGSITSSGNITTSSATGRIGLGTDSGGSISLGKQDNTASFPFIDFNTGATSVDFDVRIAAAGGTGTSGNGGLTITAASTALTGIIRTPLGTVSAPSYTFTGDTNTGMWSPAADTIAFSEGGTEVMRINSSSNVGVGTTAPGAKFHVGGGTVGTTAGNLLNVTIDEGLAGGNGVGIRTNLVRVSNGTDWTTTAMRLQGRVDATDFGYIDLVSGGAQGMAFGSGGAERMRIDSSGNVGIGTSSPGTTLDVAGTLQSKPAAGTFPQFNLNSLDSGKWKSLIAFQNSGSNKWEIGVDPSNNGTNSFYFYDNAAASERMRIDSSGNVGIGTSSPGTKLDVLGTSLTRTDSSGGDSPLVVRNDSTASSTTKSTGLLFQGVDTVGTAKNTGLVQCGPSDVNYVTSYLAFQTRSGDVLAERARIDSSGNVGIGTTAPTAKLHVQGTGYFNDDLTVNGGQVFTGSTQARVKFGVWTDTTYGIGMQSGYTYGGLVNDYAMTFQFSNTNTRGFWWGDSSHTNAQGAMALTTNGKLTIAHSVRVGFGETDATVPGSVYILDVSGAANIIGNTNIGGSSGTYQGLSIRNSDDSAVGETVNFIDARNNLGTAAGHLFFHNQTDGGAYITLGNTPAGDRATDRRAERMRILADGNVGIGTTAAAQRLHVRQDQDGTTAAIIQNRNATGSPASALQFISGAFDLSDNRYAMISSVGGSSTTLQFWTGEGAAPSERMRITATGSVGIGATNPGVGKLRVVQGGSEVAFMSEGGNTPGYPQFGFSGQTADNAGRGTGMYLPGDSTLAFSTLATERIRIDSSGNVGIGTSAPGFKLDVNGTGYFNSSVQFFPQDGFRFTSASAVSAMRFGSATAGESTAEWAYNRAAGATTLSVGNTGSALNERMRIDASGNVGIGNSSPGYRLSVSGTAEITAAKEGVFTITDGTTVNLDPNNGSIQTWTLGASRTPGQVNWATGQSITLMIDDGSAFAVTWTTLGVVWETNGGTAPTLATTGFTVIVLWKVGTTIYGARVGDA